MGLRACPQKIFKDIHSIMSEIVHLEHMIKVAIIIDLCALREN